MKLTKNLVILIILGICCYSCYSINISVTKEFNENNDDDKGEKELMEYITNITKKYILDEKEKDEDKLKFSDEVIDKTVKSFSNDIRERLDILKDKCSPISKSDLCKNQVQNILKEKNRTWYEYFDNRYEWLNVTKQITEWSNLSEAKKNFISYCKLNFGLRSCFLPKYPCRCFGYYLSRNPNILNGYVTHIGISILDLEDNFNSYGLTLSGEFKSPDPFLEGGDSGLGKKVPVADKVKYLSDRFGSPVKVMTIEDLEKKLSRDQENYSMIGVNGKNSADVIVEVASKLGHKIDCNYLGMNISDSCVLN